MVSPADKEAPALTVLYDGACPLCRREIGLYQGMQPNAPLCFADVSDTRQSLPPGTSRDQLMARFHVRCPDGRLLSGAEAFVALWGALPGWRWLAMTARWPGVLWLMERGYRGFLLLRPGLQRWVARLDRSRARQ
jgi:predicted DCC family thiol-disulfide oxidoreductase YuxK